MAPRLFSKCALHNSFLICPSLRFHWRNHLEFCNFFFCCPSVSWFLFVLGEFLIMYNLNLSYCKLLNKIKLFLLNCLAYSFVCSITFHWLLFSYMWWIIRRLLGCVLNLSCETRWNSLKEGDHPSRFAQNRDFQEHRTLVLILEKSQANQDKLVTLILNRMVPK